MTTFSSSGVDHGSDESGTRETRRPGTIHVGGGAEIQHPIGPAFASGHSDTSRQPLQLIILARDFVKHSPEPIRAQLEPSELAHVITEAAVFKLVLSLDPVIDAFSGRHFQEIGLIIDAGAPYWFGKAHIGRSDLVCRHHPPIL